MNQKLRATRGVVVILFAILCIVCLSLSLMFSSHFAAYADEGDTTVALPDISPIDGSHLWLMYYENGPAEGEPLWDGIHEGQAIHYLDVNDALDDGFGVCVGTNEQKDFFAPYRGVGISIKLNPNYKLDETNTLGDKYDLSDENVVYSGSVNVTGISTGSINVSTTATVGGEEPSLVCVKDWKIATLCNTVDIGADYIPSERAYAQVASFANAMPSMPADVVYHFSSNLIDIVVAVRYENSSVSYWQVSYTGDGYEVSAEPYVIDGVSNETIDVEGDLINYLIRTLDVGSYTLKVTALSPAVGSDHIVYAAGGISCKFKVSAQDISNSNFEQLFGTPVIDDNDRVVFYTGDSSWSPAVQLKIGNIVLRQGTDYTTQLASCDAGWVDLHIIGIGNLTGQYTIPSAIRIMPAENDWNEVFSIIPWSYGDYNANFNVIVGMPMFGDIEDITFRIVRVDDNGNDVLLEGLNDIHYVLVEGSNQFTVSSAVSEALAKLEVGQYRLYASVKGADSASSNKNYTSIEEKGITFYINKGNNSWGEKSVPTIVSWTAGKFDPKVNTITATDRFGNDAVVIIRNGKGEIVYSNLPEHAVQDFGAYGKDANEVANILKKLKAGYYTLQAEVEGTQNYNELNTLIDFSIARNGLPAWAVALIVIGCLGIVALVFGLLHQKGVLQMLTGKVIVSMRTRANVDATLAAIRAAKVAREAEASIAAAKAREAEEAAKATQNNEDKQ